jgi:alcohol dehydrogenase (NADP+)
MTDIFDAENGSHAAEPGRRSFLKLAAGSGALGITSLAASRSAYAATDAQRPAAAYAAPFAVSGYAATSADSALAPFDFQRRAVGTNDVAIEIHYCGVCHSDIHTSRGHWGQQRYPLITGHEIAGLVTAVGSGVSEFRVGDRVGVGCMVNSCGHCAECGSGFEQYCENGSTMTYGTGVSADVEPTETTQGGYSTGVVVDKDFIIRIPDDFELAAAGPVMCAAVTVYSPLRHWNVRKGSKIGVVGLGGLGHFAVKIAKALGAEIVVFTTSPDKVEDARKFGASDVVVNYEEAKMTEHARSLDFILNTVPYHHEMDPLVSCLKRDATMCLVGIGDVTQPNQLSPFTMIQKRNSFAGSLIGSIRETQEVIDFCDLHGIAPEYKLLKMADLNQTWEDVIAKRARYRYVLDVKA